MRPEEHSRGFGYITDARDLPDIARGIDRLGPNDCLGLDIETTGLDPYTSRIRLIQLRLGQTIYVIDVFQTKQLFSVQAALSRFSGILVGHNLKFEQKFFLLQANLRFKKLFDTYRASAIIYNGKREASTNEPFGHNLWDVEKRELGIDHTGDDEGLSDWSRPVLSENQLRYAANDVRNLFELREELIKKLHLNGLNRIALIEFQALLPEAAMELRGFPFDADAWRKLAAENTAKRDIYHTQLKAALPHPDGQLGLFGAAEWNVDSNEQVLRALRRLGIPAESTDAIHLAQLAPQYPILELLDSYRNYSKAVDSFGLEYLKNVHPVTGRIHTHYWPYTGAGRYSSSKPNLQQVPRSKAFRSCFRARAGTKLVIRDYSQIELRIAAEIANDWTLIKTYQNGGDAHTETARGISGSDNPTKADRQQAKPVNFGYLYGMGAAKGVVYAQANYGVTWSLEQATRFRDMFLTKYSGIKKWHRQVFSEANRNRGYTRTILGRIRYIDPTAYNEFANTPVQGSAADGMKISLRCVYDRMSKLSEDLQAGGIHMVHDELLSEVINDPEACRIVDDAVRDGMAEGMSQVISRVPVVTEGGYADSWAEK